MIAVSFVEHVFRRTILVFFVECVFGRKKCVIRRTVFFVEQRVFFVEQNVFLVEQNAFFVEHIFMKTHSIKTKKR